MFKVDLLDTIHKTDLIDEAEDYIKEQESLMDTGMSNYPLTLIKNLVELLKQEILT